MKNTPASTSITFRLPSPLVNWLKKTAKREGRTQTYLVNNALESLRANLEAK